MISLGFNRTPQDLDREALKVHRLNKERVCKKRLAIRMEIAKKQEIKALADSLKETWEL